MRNINLIFHVQYHPVNFRQKICSSRDRERDETHNVIVRTQSVDKFGNPTEIKRSYFEIFGRPSDRVGFYRFVNIVFMTLFPPKEFF